VRDRMPQGCVSNLLRRNVLVRTGLNSSLA
jgi:hypothetical protein